MFDDEYELAMEAAERYQQRKQFNQSMEYSIWNSLETIILGITPFIVDPFLGSIINLALKFIQNRINRRF